MSCENLPLPPRDKEHKGVSHLLLNLVQVHGVASPASQSGTKALRLKVLIGGLRGTVPAQGLSLQSKRGSAVREIACAIDEAIDHNMARVQLSSFLHSLGQTWGRRKKNNNYGSVH